MPTTLVELGKRIRAERQKRQLTLEKFSKKTGLSKSFLSQIERGNTEPSITSLKKIAAEFGYSVVNLFPNGNGSDANWGYRNGATEHAAIARVTNLQKTLLALSRGGLEIIGLDAGGEAELRDLPADTTGRVLVVGSEGKGLRRMVRERCDTIVQIRQEGQMDSLNASVAAAIAMYEISGKRIVDGG